MHRGQHGDYAQYDNGPPMAPSAGHNHADAPYQPAQWQLLHSEQPIAQSDVESDLDLVAAAFAEGFITASDPTSFLRLARVPFEATAADGAKLSLLRVEINAITDVGAIMPHLGGASFRYDPLPGRMASRRKLLRLIYFDGQGLRALDLAEAMRLSA
ncbi:MAG TPA: hypothetical protein VGJ20_23130 [Xanthobacteraceae bacterium]|jgi:hypothetical protein